MSWLLKHLKVLYWWPAVVALCPGNLYCGLFLLLMGLLASNVGEKSGPVAAFSSPLVSNCCSMFFHYFHNSLLFPFLCHLVTSVAPILSSLKLFLFLARICTCNIFYKYHVIDLLCAGGPCWNTYCSAIYRWKLQSFSSLESHLNGGVEPSVGISDGEDVGRI